MASLHLAVPNRFGKHVQRFGLIDGDSTCSSVSWSANGYRYAAAVRSAGVVSRLKSSVSARMPYSSAVATLWSRLWSQFLNVLRQDRRLPRWSVASSSGVVFQFVLVLVVVDDDIDRLDSRFASLGSVHQRERAVLIEVDILVRG